MKAKQFYSSSAWIYFSRYILLKHSQDGKTVKCVTSGKEMLLNSKDSCAGHWIKVFESSSNTHFSTAFEETNCYPQSNYDNRILGGRPDKMEAMIIRLHGENEAERLKILSKKPFKMDKSTLDEIKEIYKDKFNEQIKLKGNNPWK